MKLLIVGAIASLFASNADAQAPVVTGREIKNVVPAAAAVEQFVLTPDSARTYYRPATGGLWMYDRTTNATKRLLDAVVWDITLAPTKNALAYTKLGENAREQHVWVLPLSATTGLASGKEHQASLRSGDVPSISPDGKLLAFARDDETGVGQTVVVVPIAGGTERVVAPSQPSGVSSIRWAPDGKTVYFGVNAPLPFTCAESCLTGARESRPSSTIRKVSATGGSVATVATVGAPGPGLSPDGKYMVFADSGTSRRFILADKDGTHLKTFSVASSQTLVGWAGSSTLLAIASGPVRRLHALSLPDGVSRVLSQSNDFIFLPAWTPDSKSVSVNRYGPNGCELTVMNADGSTLRTIPISKTGGCSNVAWTSDQRWIVTFQFKEGNSRPVLSAIEVSTGQSKALRTLNDNNNSMQWMVDRDVVVISEGIRDANGARRAISQIDLAGTVKLLREIPVETGTTVTLVDRNSVIIARTSPRDFRVMSLATGDMKPLAAVASGAVSPRIALSADHEWMGYLTGADNTQFTKVELVKIDGRDRKTINLTFAAEGDGGMVVMSGGTGAAVGERRTQGQPSNVYFVNATGAKQLFTYVGQQAEFALSPDGRTVLYLLNELLPPTISAIDISTIK